VRHAATQAPLFLDEQPASHDAYATAMACAQRVVVDRFARLPRAYSGATPQALESRFVTLDPCPEHGEPLDEVLHWVGQHVLADVIAVGHPMTMAHLHCAPLVPALAAEAMISAVNASMDSWDQAPAPSHFEQRIVAWLCARFGLGDSRLGEVADGIFTSGGTQSNFLALLLARDRFCQRHFGVAVQRTGLPPQASKLRVLCSSVAHFSVQQSAAILGLGHDAVMPVEVDASMRMDAARLQLEVTRLRAEGLLPMAVVATAGTTDFGSIDPLPAVAHVAEREGMWLHIDAAYGGALVFSDRLRPLLDGIDRADSLTVDFHKLFWQPISASALLLRERSAWELLRLHADYLNPESAESAGTLDLVTKSIQTTRRFDSLKLFVSLRTLGRQHFAALIEQTVDLAAAAAACIDADSFFERVAPVAINSVVFRCVDKTWSDTQADRINAHVREQLLLDGRAVIGRTRVRGRTCLKFTLLNPGAEIVDIQRLLQELKSRARQLSADAAA
jgi:L-2,4-diaminobutyrate decarboxylase